MNLQDAKSTIPSDNIAGHVLLMQHKSVYTLGSQTQDDWLRNTRTHSDLKYETYQVERGGEATYHGPGQLMIYFLLNLRRLGWGPKKLICELEGVMIDLLSKYGIDAKRKIGAPGIYVQEKKIASIGLKIKKGHCYHGISLNVDMDLKPFKGIVTCGIDSLEVVQLKDLADVSMKRIKQDLVNILREYDSKAA